MINAQDLVTVGFLVFLEGILSVDNALVLALLASGLPKHQRKKALTYGIVGAIFFRLGALAMVTQLMQWQWVKFAGGGYLLAVGMWHFFGPDKKTEKSKAASARGFWKTIILIELMDIAFAVDSILAAVALSNKFWVVFTGGVLGLILMRFAATVFLGILDRFPKFETTAYMLVVAIGVKLVVDGLRLPGVDFHSAHSPAFWVFWLTMLGCIVYGFMPDRRRKDSAPKA